LQELSHSREQVAKLTQALQQQGETLQQKDEALRQALTQLVAI